ncbi:MAG TPA: ATP-binding protein [Balneola sp.]|jgi:two-component system, NtrC family, nitrogen regulation sensor histidine kinase NtrY|nr:ATP-binding protein [Balneola sp.]MAO76232.1 ATP-binding protein [Balneola sp.]MBF63917.1 ATP-binding protein [Balneola sp.]HAH51610.1 ATP-binding protein [Balneola sp.]HAW80719.1 ATP-binding protein [Balneola sp.]|tara:strand:- start:19962 stop:21326 length:1365 start_codon:yes stop_codon:yes gene_type:complete
MLKNLRIGVIIRVLVLFIVLSIGAYLAINTEYYVSLILIGVVVILQVINLIRFVEITNKNLKRFFEAISYNDFSQSFSNKGSGKSLESLNSVFNNIIEKFNQERSKGEESYLYLETVVQHIGIGLFSFNKDGEIELLNTAAKKILGTAVLRNVSQLKNLSEPLYDAIQNLKSGARTLVRLSIKNRESQVAIFATEFRVKGDMYKIISLSNISSELEEKEMEAWQNLTQVLAHEIMNSITPIASLSDTVNSMLSTNLLAKETTQDISEETLKDVKEALQTINNRSLGLMRFVDSYRNITQIPTPDFEVVLLKEIVDRVKNLMKGEALSRSITVETEFESDSIEVVADSQLIEQSLINVVKNAFKALKNHSEPRVVLKCGIDESGHAYIDVQDNGPGIKKSSAEKIFVPFYTTSKNSTEGGSGIGLSLSRQIMRLHNGSLYLLESENGKTIFRLRF